MFHVNQLSSTFLKYPLNIIRVNTENPNNIGQQYIAAKYLTKESVVLKYIYAYTINSGMHKNIKDNISSYDPLSNKM
ncbi:putative ORFan [Tupanvirus deep ocean]|uniref:ORFan n=2 Tax=Tupanvirus TaxID=2094720 RepID=A0AC62A949_9VIRU|nr:putative ORFan [Tupanvirus deep ocean]QKU34301.1 putative ORFan [Tupanvirus deep ocean]